jgi:RNA recognition motif-containing protein
MATIANARKRKQAAALPDEIEVDVLAPEPPSKKARRRVKKGKPVQSNESRSSRHYDFDSNDLLSSPSPVPLDGDNTTAPNAPDETQKAVYGVWIGNLPFTLTSKSLRSFLTSSSTRITDWNISRIHMTAPPSDPKSKGAKPFNKGFAYVDFSEEDARRAALELSETQLGGRNLLIKNSQDFHGRPEKPANGSSELSATAKRAGELASNKPTHPPSRRVFVGNLGYDMTKEDLQRNYEPCGEIADIHAATFEDSGRSKGFAWVTFGSVEAAESAVRGWVKKVNQTDDGGKKSQKWFVNRIHGRSLRCEFAEDPGTRYKRRFGKKHSGNDATADDL